MGSHSKWKGATAACAWSRRAQVAGRCAGPMCASPRIVGSWALCSCAPLDATLIGVTRFDKEGATDAADSLTERQAP